jgi:hypothetical protein
MLTGSLAWLNEAGLIVAMVGGGLIFFCWELEAAPGTRRRRYQRAARFGLLLIIVGFAMQAWAVLPIWQSPPSLSP